METQTKTEPGKIKKVAQIQKITPFLWFDNQTEEAVNFYIAVFNNSKIKTATRYGEEGAQQCGWLQDKFGVSWQIVPKVLEELLSDPVKSGSVMQSMLQMKKLDLNILMKAHHIS